MAVGDVPPQARVFASIGQGWTNMWSAFWILLAFGVIEMIASALSQPGQFVPADNWQLSLALAPVAIATGVLLIGPLGLGVTKAHLKVTRGEKPEWSDLGYGFTRWPQAILLTLLSMVIVIAGFMLLIIPGIYLAIKLTFAAFRFVQDDLDAMDAIKASWDDTKGRWWNVFGLMLMSIPLIIAGFLALGVGFFVAVVLIEQAAAVYFRALDSN